MVISASRRKQLVSYLMIAVGCFFLLSGARNFLEWRLGQSGVAHDFASRTPVPPSPPQPVEAVAKLSIPRLDTEFYVVEGDGESELRRGPGHLIGTAMPGDKGNCVIAGHRDTHFRVLKDIQRGDVIRLETRSGQYLYRVQTTAVVSPENDSALKPTPDAQLHLITCYPFYYVGPAPKRFVVEAELANEVAGYPGELSPGGRTSAIVKYLDGPEF